MELHTMLVEKCLRFRTLMLRSSVEKLSIQRDAEMPLLERSAHTRPLGKLMRNHSSTRTWRLRCTRHTPRTGDSPKNRNWNRAIQRSGSKTSGIIGLVRTRGTDARTFVLDSSPFRY